jgi:FkbM family methyltransferase
MTASTTSLASTVLRSFNTAKKRLRFLLDHVALSFGYERMTRHLQFPNARRDPEMMPSFAQQGEDLVLDRILKRKLGLPRNYKGFYIDVGAYHPKAMSVTYLLYCAGWRGICIDMSDATCRLFEQQRPRDKAVCTAVGDQEGRQLAYFLSQSPSGSNTLNPAAADLLARSSPLIRKHVPLTTLDNIIAAHAPGEAIDFVNIDVEGHELYVLKGIDLNGPSRPTCIAIEIHASDVRSALASEVAVYLELNGYQCVACCVITYFFTCSRRDSPDAEQHIKV